MDALAAGIVSIAALLVRRSSRCRSTARTPPCSPRSSAARRSRSSAHNYHPAKIFMGDSGALALGFVLASVAVQGVLKTAATIALVAPLLVLAVPILDTSFVVLKRLKYRRAPWGADQNHFYHRFMRIGLLAAAHGRVPARLGGAARGLRDPAPLRPAAAARRLGPRQRADRGRRRPGRRRGLGLDGLLARDPQGAPPPGPRTAARVGRGAGGEPERELTAGRR